MFDTVCRSCRGACFDNEFPETLLKNIWWLTQWISLFCFAIVMFFLSISESMFSKAIVNPGWQLLSCSFKDSFAFIAKAKDWHSSAHVPTEQTWEEARALSCNSFVFKFSFEILCLAAWSGPSKLSPKTSSLLNADLLEQVILSLEKRSRVPLNEQK